MVRAFQVASLVFTLDLPDAHAVTYLLHNYDPFEVGASPGSQPPETSFGPHRCASLAVPPLTMPRVARFPGAAAGEAPSFADVASPSFADVIGESIFRLTITSEPPAGPREVLYQPKEESGEPVIGLYRTATGYLAEFAVLPGRPVCGQLAVSDDFREGRLFAEGDPASQAFAVNNALMLLFAFASAPYRALEMHASVVVRGGRGFLFLGRSGTGKSTHSSLWLKHIPGSELLNDDNPVLRIVDGRARVYGTPWSGKTPCYKAEDYPVGAIVRLRQAPENRIARLGTVAAYASVMASCSGFRPIRTLADAQHETLAGIAADVPCYQLDCLPDEAAARLCQETIDG